MSVHRKDNRWVVRWRDGQRQRSRSFLTKREASVFDRETNQGIPGDYDRALAGLDAALAYAQTVRGCAFPVALIERAHKLMQIIQGAEGLADGARS
jgi:hypothetical protein